jgi:hypothetical protein
LEPEQTVESPSASVSGATTLPEETPLSSREIEAAIRDFRNWTTRYFAEQGPKQESLKAEGKARAMAHRRALKQLISEDPRHALEAAVPVVLRQKLPSEIRAALEERINAPGFYGVYAASGAPSIAPIRRIVEIAGKNYHTFTYGRRLEQKTTAQALLNGVAIDDVMALDERPLRVLESGEIPDPAKPAVETCPISGISSAPRENEALPPVTAETAAVEVGGVIHYLCSGGHIVEYERQLVAREGGTGGPISPSMPTAPTVGTGVKSCLYLRVAFPESHFEPQSEAGAYDLMKQVSDWYVQNSYGKLSLLSTVTPLVVLPSTETFYTTGGGNEYKLMSDALAVAAAMGYDASSFDLYIVAYTGGPGNFNGLGTIGGAGVWLRTSSVGVAIHELGHNLGLWHANSWDTSGQSVIGAGTHVEYGNLFDTMGPAAGGSNQFNAAHKNLLDWLTKEYVHEIRRSGMYRIYAFDQPQLDPANRYAFSIQKDNTRFYWGEFRQSFGDTVPSLRDGILLNWSPWSKSQGGTHLLDTTPGSADGMHDAALTIGTTFSDWEAGIHITPIGKGGTVPESVDVVVNLGPFPGNHPPALTANADQTSVAAGATVQFSAIATDPEGDALSYSWSFGDGTFAGSNASSVSKSWGSAGDYVVRCVVSDMKGGTASDSVLVRVGSPNTFSISGQVTVDGQPLANVRVSNGLAGNSYRGASTDSHGSYTITGLGAGTIPLTAVLYGYSFTPTFANPVSVGPNYLSADFTATLVPTVAIAATDPSATEGGDTGRFTLTRTGSTAASLTVAMLSPSGTALSFLDYFLAPNPSLDGTNMWYVVTIPAGQASRDIVLTPSADANIEGPETATVTLLPTAAYVIAGPQSATITIQDANSTLPLVSILALDAEAAEDGDSATLVVSRTGPTSNALSINLSVSGAAANGNDYIAIPATVVIPSGAASAEITILPKQDTEVEGDEDVIVTISSSANYLIAASTQTARAYLVDDDTPTVTIYATDASASEAGQDPATFVVKRTGALNAPLTVNYALSGTAQHGVDYAILPGVLTIPAGNAEGSITVVPIDDNIGEAEQTIGIQIRAGIGYAVGNPSAAAATLADNDVPVVTVGVTDGKVGEPNDAGQFRFTTTGTGSGTITIHYTVSGAAAPGVDYVALSGTLTMGRNTTATVEVIPIDDALPEDWETITVTIDPDPSYSIFLDKSATLELFDNEQNIVSAMAGADAPIEDDSSPLTFYLERKGSTAAALTVHYTMGGTATNGVDYQTLSGTATIPAGQAGVQLAAFIIDDSVFEGTEWATLTLASDPAYGIGIPSARQYIPEASTGVPPPSSRADFATAGGSGSEAVGTVNVPVTLSSTPASSITVEYIIGGGSALGGIDYVPKTGLLTFGPGITTQYVPLTILEDSLKEPAETVTIQLKNAWRGTIGNGTYTFTINDNDAPPPPTVGFAQAASAVGENASAAAILVSLSAVQSTPVTVHFTTSGGTATGSGVDYSLNPGTLIFAPGETVKSIPIAIVDDLIDEPDETVVLTLDSPVGATLNANASHTCTIQNLSASLEVTAAGGLVSSGPSGGPFGPQNKTYTLKNIGDSPLHWTAAASAEWVALSPANGTLGAGASTQVTVGIGAPATLLAPQNHGATVSFTNTTNNAGNTNRNVSLTVLLAAPVFNPEPAVTNGASNTVSWIPIPMAEFYEVQRSGSASFASVSSSGWIQATACTFEGLADNVPYFYRVRAWRTAASPSAGPWSETVSSTQNTATGAIGDYVWSDLNGNGAQDPGEPGFAGAQVTLNGPGGLQSTTTDANGSYQFSNLRAGTYTLTVMLPAGYQFATSPVGTDPAVDSNSSPATVILATNSSMDATVDFGFVNPVPAITITTPEEQAMVLQPQVLLQGTASDAHGIQSIKINGVLANSTDAFASWNLAVSNLAPGNNVLTISATDQAVPPQTSTVIRTVFYASETSDTDHDGLSDAWELQHGLDLFDNGAVSAVNGAFGDGDRDGLVNLLEYATNHDPGKPDASGNNPLAFEINPADGKKYLVFSYTRRIAANGISYVVECSEDLRNWASGGSQYEEAHPPVMNPDGKTEQISLRIKPSTDSLEPVAKFVRLRVSVEP